MPQKPDEPDLPDDPSSGLPDDPITAGPGASSGAKQAAPSGGKDDLGLPDDPITAHGRIAGRGNRTPFEPPAPTPEQKGAQARTEQYLQKNQPPGFAQGFTGTLSEDAKNLFQTGQAGFKAVGSLIAGDPGPLLNMGWESVKGMGQAQLADLQKARDAHKRGSNVEAAGYMATGLTPILGPAVSQIAEDIGRGDYGAAAAHATELVGPEALRFAKVGPLARTVTRPGAEARAVEETAQKGVRTSLGQRTGSIRMQKVERNLMNFAGSERDAAEFYEGQQLDLHARAKRLAGQVAPDMLTKEDAGLGIKNRLLTRYQRFKSGADKVYDDVRSKAAMAKQTLQNGWTYRLDPITRQYTPVPEMKTFEAPVDIRQMKRDLLPVWKEFDAAFQDPARRAANPGLRTLEQLMRTPDWYMDAMDLDRTLSAIKSLVREKNGVITSPILTTQSGRIAKQVIASGEKQLDRAFAKIHPAFKAELNTGRVLVRAYHETADFAESLGEEPGVVADRLLRKTGHGALEDLRTLRNWAPQELDTLARSWFEGEIRKATQEGGFQRTAGLYADWNALEPEVREVMFGKQRAEEIQNFLLAAKKLNPAEGSNTAGKIATFLPGIGATMGVVTESVAALLAGHPGAAVAAPIAGYAGYRAVEHTVPRLLARSFFQPGGARLWTQAITLPGGSKAWTRTMQTLNARMIGAKQQVQKEDQERGAPQAAAPAAETGPGAPVPRPAAAAAQSPPRAGLAPGASPVAPSQRGAEYESSGQPTRRLNIPMRPTPAAGTATPAPAARAAPAAAPRVEANVRRWSSDFQAIGQREQVPPGLLATVAQLESSGRPDAVGSSGERGLMQLMPSTARALGVDPTNPQESIRGAATLLRRLMGKYQGELWKVLAAYNEGETAFDRRQARQPGMESLPPVTQRYVRHGLALLRSRGQEEAALTSSSERSSTGTR